MWSAGALVSIYGTCLPRTFCLTYPIDLFEASYFYSKNSEGILGAPQHLVRMMSILVPLPAELLKRSESCLKYCGKQNESHNDKPKLGFREFIVPSLVH